MKTTIGNAMKIFCNVKSRYES